MVELSRDRIRLAVIQCVRLVVAGRGSLNSRRVSQGSGRDLRLDNDARVLAMGLRRQTRSTDELRNKSIPRSSKQAHKACIKEIRILLDESRDVVTARTSIVIDSEEVLICCSADARTRDEAAVNAKLGHHLL